MTRSLPSPSLSPSPSSSRSSLSPSPSPSNNPPPFSPEPPQTLENRLEVSTHPKATSNSLEPSEAFEAPRQFIDPRNHSQVLTAILGNSVENREQLLADYHRVHLVRYLDRYGPPREPTRNPILQMDDVQILERIGGCQVAKKEDREFLRAFGYWRGSVLKWETAAEGSLEILLLALRRFDAVEDHESAFETRRYIGNVWRHHLGDDQPVSDDDARRLAKKWSTRLDLLGPTLRRKDDRPVQQHEKEDRTELGDEGFDYGKFD